MTDRYYRIAGIPVLVRMEEDEPLPLFEGFTEEGAVRPQMIFELYQENKRFRQFYGIEYCHAKEGQEHVFLSRSHPKVRMTANAAWDRMVVEGCASAHDGVMEVILAGFYSFFSLRGGMLLHASAVRWREEAVVFTAASGTGKTTQAQLWEKYKKAEILNGDKVLIDCAADGCCAWGSPWRGSSPYAMNTKAPLRAVVVLEQAQENRIRRIEGEEALARLSPHFFYPSWNEECVLGVMDAFGSLMRRTPVYLLSCLPDEDAVALTCEKLWGESD